MILSAAELTALLRQRSSPGVELDADAQQLAATICAAWDEWLDEEADWQAEEDEEDEDDDEEDENE